MRKPETPKEYCGFPVLDSKEVKLIDQIFREAEANEAKPITQKLGMQVVETNPRIVEALEYHANYHVEILASRSVDRDYIDNFTWGFYEGFYAVAGIISWVNQHRRGTDQETFLRDATKNGDIPDLTKEIIQRYFKVLSNDTRHAEANKSFPEDTIIDELGWKQLGNSESGDRGKYSDMLSYQTSAMYEDILVDLEAAIRNYAISMGLDDSELSDDAFNEGMLSGMLGLAALFALAHETKELHLAEHAPVVNHDTNS